VDEELLAEDSAPEPRVGRHVVDAAGVVEELPQRDPVAVVPVPLHDAGQPSADLVVEVESALGLQLEEHRGDEGLGDAADPVVVVGAARALPREVADARGGVPGAVAVLHLCGGAGDVILQYGLHRPLCGAVPLPAPGVRRERGRRKRPRRHRHGQRRRHCGPCPAYCHALPLPYVLVVGPGDIRSQYGVERRRIGWA
jgi:hypothetical protein